MTPRGYLACATFAALLAPRIASAQAEPEGPPIVIAPATNGVLVDSSAPAAQDDVAWHQTRVPYRGGPVRPGTQLDERLNLPFVGGGFAALVLGFVFKLYGGPANEPVVVVPLVGGFIAGANALGTAGNTTNDYSSSGTYFFVGGVLEVLGTAAMTYGFFAPLRSLVSDEPAHPYGAMAMLPGAPGAPLGASFVGTF